MAAPTYRRGHATTVSSHTPAKLLEFETRLRNLDGSECGWPFLCEGSPFNCKIFLVGINPVADVAIWPHWSIHTGLKRDSWLDDYRAKHYKFTRTRVQLERLVKAIGSAGALETNIYHHRSPRFKELAKHLRITTVFDFLIDELRPRVIFVHGRPAIKHLQSLIQAQLTLGEFVNARYKNASFDVIAGRHLSRGWSTDKLAELGEALQTRAVNLASSS
jgi:hypothetical protein